MQEARPFFHKVFHYLACRILTVLAAAGPFGAAVASAPPAATRPAPGENLRVYLVTMGPAGGIEEVFGHNAVVIDDDSARTGVAYNFGVFDFEAPNFVGRFIRGGLDYWMEPWDAAEMMQDYAQRRDRSVWVQELNLTPGQRFELWQALERNALPANRMYPYDYYADNCSTRVRDALDRAVGGAIRERLFEAQTGQTYRSHTLRLTQGSLPLYTGLNFVLGHKTDRALSAWEESFLPVRFMERIRSVQVRDEAGGMTPLVKKEWTYHQSRRFPEPQRVPVRWPGYLLAGLLLGGVFAGLAWMTPRHWGYRAAFAAASAAWLVLGAVGAVVVAGMRVFTSHEAAYANENALQLNLLALPLALLLPMLVTKRRRWPAVTMWMAVAMAGLAFLGLLLKALPWFHQANWEIIALALPAQAGLAVAAWLLTAGGRGAVPAPQLAADQRENAKRPADKKSGKS